MNSNRRSIRQLEPANGYDQSSPVGPLRASTYDSGRGSMDTSQRTSARDSTMTNGASSSLSRDTPLDGDNDNAHERDESDTRVQIPCSIVLQNKCYEQAFVSHVDHPSAFFLQLAHSERDFVKLNKEIDEFYSKNATTNPSTSWKRGDYCIAKYNDNQFYRARIIETPKNTDWSNLYDVVYLDYGNCSKVVLTDIYPLLPKFARLPAQAVPCSLTKTLPRSGTWFDHPEAMELFKELVFEKFVDATFHPKSARDFWHLAFVDLSLSSSESEKNVRALMSKKCFIRPVQNEEIYVELNHLLRPADYIIYSIRHEDEGYDDD